MTPDRIKQLEDIGFVWNFNELAFNHRLSQLMGFKEANNHCNVPYKYDENPE